MRNERRCTTRGLLISLLAWVTVVNVGYVIAQGNGSTHSQNVKQNDGVTVQINVENHLRKAALSSQLDERGWMRLLTPAHDPDPPNACSSTGRPSNQTEKALKVFYGTNVAFCAAETCNIVVGELHGAISPLITVRRTKSGFLVNAKVFDANGNIIANIEGDKPHINRNFVSDFNRPDEHSLWIKDNHDEKVSYIRLLNEKSLLIEGVFYLPNDVRSSSPPHAFMTITKDKVVFEPTHSMLSENCFSDLGVATIIFSDR